MRRYYSALLFLVILSAFSQNSYSQPIEEFNSLFDSSLVYLNSGDYQKALEWGKKTFHFAEKNFNELDTNYLVSVLFLTQTYFYLKDMDSALKYARLDSVLSERKHGSNHKYHAVALNNIATIYQSMGKFDLVEQTYRKTIKIYENSDSSQYRNLANTYNNLSVLFVNTSQYLKAENESLKMLEVLKNARGEDSPEYLDAFKNLASIYSLQGKYNKSCEAYRKAIKGRRILYGEEHPRYAMALFGLANTQTLIGDFLNAENNFLKVLSINKKKLGESHPEYLLEYMELAKFYCTIGNYEKSLVYFQDCIARQLNYKPEKNPNLAEAFAKYAILLKLIKQYDSAIVYNNKARNINLEIYGKSIQYAYNIMANANIYEIKGLHNISDSLYCEAKAVVKKTLGKNHPEYANLLNNYAVLKIAKQEYQAAIGLIQTALDILENQNKQNEFSLIQVTSNLLKSYWLSGQIDSAMILNQMIMNRVNNLIPDNFSFMNEMEKLNYYQNNIRVFVKEFNAFCFQNFKSNPKLSGLAYNNHLLHHGLFLKSGIKLRSLIQNTQDSILEKEYSQYIKFREQIAFNKNRNAISDSIQESINNLEKTISKKIKIPYLDIFSEKKSWQEVCDNLEAGEAAIEIIRFDRYGEKEHINRPGVMTNGFLDSISYAALIITNKTADRPNIVIIENGKELENTYLDKYNAIIFPPDSIMKNYKAYKAYQQNIKKELQNLYEQYWAKIDKKLSGYHTFYVSGDGVYNKINIQTLVNQNNTYINETANIINVTTTAGIKKNRSERINNCVLIGNPAFEESIDISKQSSPSNKNNDYDPLFRSLNHKKWTALPGSELEISNIKKIAASNNVTTRTYLENHASESEIKSIMNPKVLHFATHGYFDNKFDILPDTLRYYKSSYNNLPMLTSGLVLSGANTISDTVFNNELLYDDGYLTAYEVMSMNLDSTYLVVLSACETARGMVQTGEGVIGLQRAFFIAGAKNLIMSLWKVDDEASKVFFTHFYQHLFKMNNINSAFRQAQLDMINDPKYAHPRFWGAYTLIQN